MKGTPFLELCMSSETVNVAPGARAGNPEGDAEAMSAIAGEEADGASRAAVQTADRPSGGANTGSIAAA